MGFDYSWIIMRRSSMLITLYVDVRCCLMQVLCGEVLLVCELFSFCFEFLLLLWTFYFIVNFKSSFIASSLCYFGSFFVSFQFRFAVNFFFWCGSCDLFVCFFCDFLFCCWFLLLLRVFFFCSEFLLLLWAFYFVVSFHYFVSF